MRITVIAVGKLKEKYWRDAVSEYRKRLGAYCRLELLETADEKTPESAGENLENAIRDKEAGRILKLIRPDSYVISLEIEGKKMDSVAFSKKLDELALRGASDITFLIGGSLGLGRAARDRADFALSFSDMTFPHQLMRVILLEQIYRAFRISRCEPYHK